LTFSRPCARGLRCNEEGLAMDPVVDPVLGYPCLRSLTTPERNLQENHPPEAGEETRFNTTSEPATTWDVTISIYTHRHVDETNKNAFHGVDCSVFQVRVLSRDTEYGFQLISFQHIHGFQLQRPLRLLCGVSHRLRVAVPGYSNLSFQYWRGRFGLFRTWSWNRHCDPSFHPNQQPSLQEGDFEEASSRRFHPITP
jgi:hypothetical protein